MHEYVFVFVTYHSKNSKSTSMITKRGCSFCSDTHLYSKKVIKTYHDEYNIESIFKPYYFVLYSHSYLPYVH